jgi:hypothetical protein
VNAGDRKDGKGDDSLDEPSLTIEANQLEEESGIRTERTGSEGGEEDEDVKRLAGNIRLCMESIVMTKGIILEYQQLFDNTASEMGEDANEIYKKHFSQGRNCLDSYLGILNLIQQLVGSLEFTQISTKLSKVHRSTT